MGSNNKRERKRSHRDRANRRKTESNGIKSTARRHGNAHLYLGDALTELTKLPEDSVDLVVSSPPYNIGKQYERNSKLSLDEYVAWQDSVIEAIIKRLKPSGSVCWQVGSHVNDGESFPLDIHFYNSFKSRGLKLRNRIIWTFNFGLHSSKRFSGRYETVLWFTKSDSYKFNLDPVRVPQLYPGKRHAKGKGKLAGTPSGNPLGKNPGDYWEFSAEQHLKGLSIWDIPNVKANHPEKTIHPCQFPIELVERCVLALTRQGDTVLDPFVGTGTTALAALRHGRKAIGIDKDPKFIAIAEQRIRQLNEGTLKVRPLGKAIVRPRPTDKVARIPQEWLQA